MSESQKKLERIVLLNLDSYASNGGITKIVESLHDRIVLICSSQRFGGKYGTFFQQLNKIIGRSGFNFVIYQSLNLIWYRLAIAISDVLFRFTGRKKRRHSLWQLAKKFNIPLLETKEINDPNVISRIREVKPDLIISFYFDQIIRKEIIGIPTFGVFNLHNAKLPKCKGPFPIICSMLKNVEGSITIHAIEDETLDTGKIYEQFSFNLDAQKDILSIERDSLSMGAGYIIQLIKKMEYDSLKGKVQDSNGFYMSFPSKEELNDLKKRGCKLFSIFEFIKTF